MEIKRKNINLLLGFLVCALIIAIIASILKPVNFNSTVAKREKEVVERMKVIRSAEARYRKINNGMFCSSIDSLVMEGYLADSLKYIPYSDGKKFEISTSFITNSHGSNVHVMECRAYYEDYLKGLNEGYVADITNEAVANGKFPGVKFGDLTMPSDNVGSWE